MSEVGSRWSEVGQRLEALGLKLKLHFEQSDRKEEIPDTLQRLKASVTEAFESAGNAVKDDAVKADVRETGRLLLDAMSASLAQASENLRDKSAATPPSTATATTPEATEPPAESKPITSE